MSAEAKKKLTIADIDEMLGISPGKKKEGKKEAPGHKLLNKTYHQRNSTGDFGDEVALANGLSKRWRTQPGWHPTARVTIIHFQHCQCCWRETEYVANELTEFSHLGLKAKILAAELITDQRLSRRIEEYHFSIPECPRCARLSLEAFEFRGESLSPPQGSVFPTLNEEFILND
jgi:hypothetical protein